MKLSKTEEQIMELIWKKERAFLKELIDCYPDPKPATTTIATLLKRMQDKGFSTCYQCNQSKKGQGSIPTDNFTNNF